MPLFAWIFRRVDVLLFVLIFSTSLFLSVFSFAQLNLAYRLLQGYFLSDDAHLSKGKPTLFMVEQSDDFSQLFKPATTGRRPTAPNFAKDMVIGIALPATTKPPRLSVSKVFVQDSILTVRYIRMRDTTATADQLANREQPSSASHPLLLIAIPKQTVLKTRLIENGKVILTVRKEEKPD